ncbi:MAG: hypothetical protein M3N16_04925 [Actinomycetota bacterium]|nr:hypothetical protein [Actinomycetota bacterium]
MASRAAAAVGGGLVAGLVGTASMTLAQAIEMRVTGREPSDVPGQVGSRLLGIDNTETLSRAVHWGHGLLGGAVRGGLALVGTSGPRAAVAHGATLWAADAALYWALGIAPAPWRWSRAELATDLLHKGLYAAVTSASYERLAR